jgi:hypothetical protein
MVNQKANIFRSQALQRYMNRHEKTVFPKLIAPSTFIYLWLIVGLLSIGGLCALFADIPIYASALAVVVEGNGNNEQGSKEVRVVLILSPEYLTQLDVNQRVFFRMNKVDALVSRRISDIEPRILSASALHSRFALNGTAATKVNESAVVAFIPFGPLPVGMDASSYLGTSYEAQVEIGRRRLISFLPLVGRFFKRRSNTLNAQTTSPAAAPL